MIGEIIVLLGAVFILVSAIGVVRFDDVLIRMHALTKASTLGMLLTLIGAAIALQQTNDVTSLLIAAVLNLLTSPVAGNLLARATYRSAGISTRIEGHDEHGGHVTIQPVDEG